MSLFWVEIGFELSLVMVLLGLTIKTLEGKTATTDNDNDDENVLNKTSQELNEDNYDYYEIESIESLGQNTTVIANTGSLEIAIEIDNKTGKILNKEKIARE